MGTPINEREASWNVQGVTLTLLRAVTDAGYVVSVHRLGGSLLGRPGFIEMHAVRDGDLPHVARVADDECPQGEDQAYTVAMLLADAVGLELND